ncbi:hypothetical protein C8R43DRAFT_956764 [Mycena crocata]|nr:hypothetical protein C8R43DRAFT_956764 [Mycena crocata]
MWLLLLLEFLLYGFADAQGDDTIAKITVPSDLQGQSAVFGFVFEAKTAQQHNYGTNVWQIRGISETIRSLTGCILRSAFLTLPLSLTHGPKTPPGEYHVRMNGTIWNGFTQLSTTTARSATFNVTEVTPFACSTPAWTPVRSLTDRDRHRTVYGYGRMTYGGIR